jgi:hypothetical protein
MIPSKRTETGARLNLSSSVQPSCVASASRKISTRVFPPNFFFQAQVVQDDFIICLYIKCLKNNRSIAVEKQSAKQKPPIEFYEGIASKQKSTYINSLAKNMLKQRNEKYACVDSDSNAIKLPEQKSKIAAEQQAINDYVSVIFSTYGIFYKYF